MPMYSSLLKLIRFVEKLYTANSLVGFRYTSSINISVVIKFLSYITKDRFLNKGGANII